MAPSPVFRSQNGPARPLLYLFLYFLVQDRNLVASRIQTRIIRKECEDADHYATATAKSIIRKLDSSLVHLVKVAGNGK